MTLELRIAHLYPDLLNLYGDRGNIATLYWRCRWRGIEVTLTDVGPGDRLNPEAYDFYFMGGGQDLQQLKVCDDLHRKKADDLKQAAKNGAVFLGICGGYQLFGHYYQPHRGEKLPGLSLLDCHTVAGDKRLIGNVTVLRPDGSTLVGFENHSGLTYLGKNLSPLGKVIKGHGNNGQSDDEGAVCGNIYGSYLHGSLLPKNPAFADELIQKALCHRYGHVSLKPLNDTLEKTAQRLAKARPA